MPTFDKIQSLLVSDSYSSKSLLEKKLAFLRAQLSILLGIVGLFYIIVDSLHGYFHNIHIYIGLFVVALFVIGLNRKGFEQLSNFILLATVNLVVYLFAASDINHKVASGVFFVPIAFCGITLYGHKKRNIGFSFALLSAVLLYISVYVDFTLLKVPDNSFPEHVFKQFYLINVMVCLIIGAMNIYFFLRINHYTETELIASRKKIEEAYVKLDKLFFVVSHDLKAPLHSIKGLINISKYTDDITELKSYIKMMEERATASENFITEIADYSKTTNTSSIKTEINLKSTVKEIVELVRFGDKSEEIRFIINIADDLSITNDLLRFRIVLSNLISNAIQYHHNNKKDRYIKISADVNEDQCEITVADNGTGIEKEHLGKIFDMFYRASTQISGSGLGLYLVKDAVNTLQGSITVESTPKEGTTFHIILPISSIIEQPVIHEASVAELI
jgi:signal transduction histidine kinase